MSVRHLMTSVLRLSPRIISTVGTNGVGRRRDRHGLAGLRLGRGAGLHGRRTLREAEEHGRPDAGRRGRRLVERVAQCELNLALGARERQALGLLGRHRHRHDRDLHGLAVFLVLLHPRAGGQHLDVGEDDLGGHVDGIVGRARRRQHVDARAGQNVAGDADDLVHAHRHGAHALGNHRRQARAGFLRGQLGRQDRLVLDDADDDAAADDLRRAATKAPSGAWPSGKCDTLRSSSFSSAPSDRSAFATTTGCVLASEQPVVAACSSCCKWRRPDRRPPGWRWRERRRFGCA